MKRPDGAPTSRDLAGQEHWDACWTSEPPPKVEDPFRGGARNRVWRRFHEYLRDRMRPLSGQGRTFLEVGCARSIFLPFFARDLGFAVHGLDYSEIGCRQTEAMLALNGVSGRVTCADLFDPPAAMRDSFDVAASFGVVEHFRDTARCLEAIKNLVKPGGHVITSIPNMAGWVGAAQRRLSRGVYDIHVPLTRQALAQAHAEAGLDVIECEYFLFSNFGVCNLSGEPRRFPVYQAKRVALASLGWMSRATWALEERVGDLPANLWTSPYIMAFARRPT